MDMHVYDICNLITSILIEMAPKDKLGLVNSIEYTIFSDNRIEINVTAPYTGYTNEEWEPPVDLEYYRNGKKRSDYNKRNLKSFLTGGRNPNQGWFDRALNQAAKVIAELYEGWAISNV